MKTWLVRQQAVHTHSLMDSLSVELRGPALPLQTPAAWTTFPTSVRSVSGLGRLGLYWVRSYTSSMDDFPDLSRVRIWVRSAGSLLGQVTHQQHGRTTSPTPVGSVSRSDQLGQVTEVIQIIWVLNKVQFHWNIVISVWVYEWTSNSTSNSVSVLTIILFTVLFMLS